MSPWDAGGSSFDRSLEREPDKPALKKPDDPVRRIRDFLKQLKARLSPRPEIPKYESKFRLSRDEVIILNLIAALEVPAGISLLLACEWSEAVRLGNQYPYRRGDDPYLLCSIGLREIFRYEDGREED